MPDVIEPAASGRAKCRACGQVIEKGALRFGERLPSPMGEGETTYWLHLGGAALRRPEPFLVVLSTSEAEIADREALQALAEVGAAHRRLPRLARAERDPSGRAHCRLCRTLIEKQTGRLSLGIWEEGRFNPAGSVHAACAPGYFEHDGRADLVHRAHLTTPALTPADLADLALALAEPPPAPPAPPPSAAPPGDAPAGDA